MRAIVNKLIAEFNRDNWHRNPYTIGANAFKEWYSTHGKNEPIPEEKLPTKEEYAAWDKEEENYVVSGILEKVGYAAASKRWPDHEVFKMKELCEGDGQCSFNCGFWDNCRFRNS